MLVRSKKRSSNPRITKKERSLLKGAIRRVFSRSDLRTKVVYESIRPGYYSPDRPRVKKWSLCAVCKNLVPTYLVAVDHVDPVVPVDSELEKMTWDEVVNRVWSAPENLQVICETCHKSKSKSENSVRRKNRARKS